MPHSETQGDQALRLLAEAVTLPVGERTAYLDRVCNGDKALRARVDLLLHMQDLRTMAPGAAGAPEAAAGQRSRTDQSLPARPPAGTRRLGHYEILEVLGEGGMGTVYLAEQDSPRRHVALKVIRAGLLSRSTLRRFEAESQVLGRLHHPGIAQIYEAGTGMLDGAEAPYFAMEYVRGLSLTDFARDRGLDIRQKLALFASVCDAVQHAHTRGVIHRDLKPGNILVQDVAEHAHDQTRVGEGGLSRFGLTAQPKILDFGIARVTDSDVAQATMQTDAGALVGTIPYMSPEQVAGDPAEVDTRSDVYTLGVILYELLAGRLPHDVSRRTIPDAIRIIAAEPPTSLGSLGREFRGEVQTIVDKAIEKDKRRRYQSAAAVAEDIRRYLTDQPITARPPSSVYRMSKFAKRHKGLVGGAAAALLILLAGIVGVGWQAARATAGWTKAEEHLAEAREARRAAEDEADNARSVSEFLSRMITAVDPENAVGRDVTMREVLDAVALTVDKDFAGRPIVEASVRGALSQSYRGLGRLEDAEQQLRAGHALCLKSFGPEAGQTIDMARNMAVVLAERGEFDQAEPLCRKTLETVQRLHGPGSLNAAEVKGELGRIVAEMGRTKEAEALLTEAMPVISAARGPLHKDTLTIRNNLATVYKTLGRLEDAAELQRSVLEGHLKNLPEDHPQVLFAKNNLATVLQKLGRNDEAAELFRQTLEARTRVLGPDHQSTITTRMNLAVCLAASGKHAQAEQQFRQCLEAYKQKLGEDHPKTLVAYGNLAYVLEDLNQMDEAEQIYRRVVELRRAAGKGGQDSETWASINNLASLLAGRGKLDEALGLYEELLSLCAASLPEGHYAVAIYRNNYGDCLMKMKKYEAAEDALLRSHAAMEKFFGAAHPRTAKAVGRLVTLYTEWGKPEKAAEWRGRVPASSAGKN